MKGFSKFHAAHQRDITEATQLGSETSQLAHAMRLRPRSPHFCLTSHSDPKVSPTLCDEGLVAHENVRHQSWFTSHEDIAPNTP